MRYQLITNDDFDNLPDDPILRFLEIVDICNRNLNSYFVKPPENKFIYIPGRTEMLKDYLGTISASAASLGIDGLGFDRADSNIERVYDAFRLKVLEKIVTLRAINSNKEKISLSMPTRNDILKTIHALRIEITNSDLAENLKADLIKKLNELEIEVHSRRINLQKLKNICLYFLVAVGSSTAFLANVPDAAATIKSIASIVSQVEDEVKEQEEQHRQLEDFTNKAPLLISDANQVKSSEVNRSPDDEIPF